MPDGDRRGLLGALSRVVGDSHVLTDPDLTAGYVVDWTGRFKGTTPGVVRPGNVAEVAQVLELCAAEGIAVVPQGGNTGLVGGAVPLRGEIVMSLVRLDGIGEFDAATAQVTAQAGVSIARLQAWAESAGWSYGVDIASRDSATVGGTVATNAGGMHVMRWGDTRAQLVGIEAVLSDGRVISHLGGLVKDNTGYDMASLFCGSEGTLAVITAARLRLVPQMSQRTVALVALDDVDDAVALVARARGEICDLDTAEIMLGSGVELVCDRTDTSNPFDRYWPVYLLLGASARDDPSAALAAVVGSSTAVRDVAVATDPTRSEALSALRERHTEAINTSGIPLKLDVGLPATVIAQFTRRVVAEVADIEPAADVWLFGHVGDGNIHVNITGWSGDPDELEDAVLRLVASLGGSISAEHGIGVAKKRWLYLNRSDTEMEAFRAIKGALDPATILNPNVLLP